MRIPLHRTLVRGFDRPRTERTYLPSKDLKGEGAELKLEVVPLADQRIYSGLGRTKQHHLESRQEVSVVPAWQGILDPRIKLAKPRLKLVERARHCVPDCFAARNRGREFFPPLTDLVRNPSLQVGEELARVSERCLERLLDVRPALSQLIPTSSHLFGNPRVYVRKELPRVGKQRVQRLANVGHVLRQRVPAILDLVRNPFIDVS